MRRAIAEMRMDVYWATTHAQIYPELRRLEKLGLIERRDDPHGARRRSAYVLTKLGEEVFLEWLRLTEQPPMELRDEGLLRLGFADALPPSEALALVRQLRKRSKDAEREFYDHIIPVGQGLLELGIRFPSIVGRLGAEFHGWMANRFAALEEELEADPTFIARSG